MAPFLTLWTVITLAGLVTSQFPPTPEGLTLKQVEALPGASISYKETTICETQARGWAGYVHLPSSILNEIETDEPYDINMFFWYFEARNDPQSAPTTIYLAGGPGDSSSGAAVSEGGPCNVLRDGNSTVSNPWSWNTNSNMLVSCLFSAIFRLS